MMTCAQQQVEQIVQNLSQEFQGLAQNDAAWKFKIQFREPETATRPLPHSTQTTFHEKVSSVRALPWGGERGRPACPRRCRRPCGRASTARG